MQSSYELFVWKKKRILYSCAPIIGLRLAYLWTRRQNGNCGCLINITV
uniref:Uncharacterized protein n=1 Tax=Arundo donax TaxID=35708 RepID=A0A0A8YJ29_ARUDO